MIEVGDTFHEMLGGGFAKFAQDKTDYGFHMQWCVFAHTYQGRLW